MKSRNRTNGPGMHVCIDAGETLQGAVEKILLAAVTGVFKGELPANIDIEYLRKRISVSPKRGNTIVEPFYIDNVPCPIRIELNPEIPTDVVIMPVYGQLPDLSALEHVPLPQACPANVTTIQTLDESPLEMHPDLLSAGLSR